MNNLHRVSSGVPAGGQFAAGQRAESDWNLATFADSDDDDPEEERCSECDEPLSDDEGEGYDGLCGDCADVAETEGRWS